MSLQMLKTNFGISSPDGGCYLECISITPRTTCEIQFSMVSLEKYWPFSFIAWILSDRVPPSAYSMNITILSFSIKELYDLTRVGPTNTFRK